MGILIRKEYPSKIAEIWSAYSPGDSGTWSLAVQYIWNGTKGCFQYFTIFQGVKAGKFTWLSQTSIEESMLSKAIDTEWYHFHEYYIGWWMPWKPLEITQPKKETLVLAISAIFRKPQEKAHIKPCSSFIFQWRRLSENVSSQVFGTEKNVGRIGCVRGAIRYKGLSFPSCP